MTRVVVTALGDIQNLTGHGPVQPASTVPALGLGIGLDYLRDAFQLQLLCGSAIRLEIWSETYFCPRSSCNVHPFTVRHAYTLPKS